MVLAGYSPSVRLFEAALCGAPIISDYWEGLDEQFRLNSEILVSNSPEDTLKYLNEMPDSEAQKMAERARARVLSRHTSLHRAEELEYFIKDLIG